MASRQQDHYETLGVSLKATDEEIVRAYRRLMRETHPDRAGATSTDQAAALNDAKAVLLDASKRRDYDRMRESGQGQAHSSESTADGWGSSEQWDAPSDWGTSSSWEEDASFWQETPAPASWSTNPDSWGDSGDWHESTGPKGPISSRWTDKDDALRQQACRLRLVGAIILMSVLALPLPIMTVMLPLDTPRMAVTMGASIVSIGIVGGMAFWLLRGPKATAWKVVAVVVIVLIVRLPGAFEAVSIPLFLGFFGAVLMYKKFRHDQRNYLRQIHGSRRWEAFYNGCLDRRRPLLYIINSMPGHEGRRTQALVVDPASDFRKNVFLWGYYPAEIWIEYVALDETVQNWASDGCRQAWYALDSQAKR